MVAVGQPGLIQRRHRGQRGGYAAGIAALIGGNAALGQRDARFSVGEGSGDVAEGHTDGHGQAGRRGGHAGVGGVAVEKIAGTSQHVPEQIVHIGVIVAEFRHAAQQRQRLRITLKVVIQQLQQPGPGQRTVVIDGFFDGGQAVAHIGRPGKGRGVGGAHPVIVQIIAVLNRTPRRRRKAAGRGTVDRASDLHF